MRGRSLFAHAVLGLGALTLLGAAPAPRTAHFDWVDYTGDDPLPADTSVGAGDYRNPILAGFYPDPSIVRADDAFYLVNSTFAYFPGLPIFRSTDLIHWTQIGNAIDRPGMLSLDGMTMWQGLYAPAISYHDHRFWIVNTCVGCGGNFVITAEDAAGPWSDPVWLTQVNGIDPSLFFDDDGSAWIVHNGPPEGKPRYEGHTAIWLERFDAATRKVIGTPCVLVDGGSTPADNPIWIEGPHLFKRDGLYYLIAAEGGTEENHSEVVFRSASVTGPYEAAPDNPILTQRDLPRDRAMPITSTGHAGFVDTGQGWWATFLGVRPYRNDSFNTGRETFLLPVAWRNGWPRVTAAGARVPYVHEAPHLPRGDGGPIPTTGPMQIHQDFAEPTLPLDWMMVRTPAERWYRLGGGATLEARPVALGNDGNPSFLARRQQHLSASVTTRVRFTPAKDGDRAGLAAFQNDSHWLFFGIEQANGTTMIRLDRRGGESEPAAGKMVAQMPVAAAPGASIDLRITAHGGRYDFAYAARTGDWRMLARDVDGTILSTQSAGGFVGATLGIHAYAAD